MASSAFYPIIYACFRHGYSQMDLEAGATRYALTVIVYLTAVTIYAVGQQEGIVSVRGHNANFGTDKSTGSMATGIV